MSVSPTGKSTSRGATLDHRNHLCRLGSTISFFGMANTYTSLHYHVIFSTKNREPWIRQDIKERIWSYLGGIARENDMKALTIGGIENHIHRLLGIPANLA